MTSLDPQFKAEALTNLKRAIDQLEQAIKTESAADALSRQQREIESVINAAAIAIQSIRTMAQQKPEVRAALQTLGTWLLQLVKQTGTEAVQERVSGLV